MKTMSPTNYKLTVQELVNEMCKVDKNFTTTVLPFSTDALVSFKVSLKSTGYYYDHMSFVARIEGTRYCLFRDYEPGDFFETPSTSTVGFKKNGFKTNGIFKKTERLARMFNLPKEIVKILDKNFEFCQITFLLAELTKIGKHKVLTTRMASFPSSTLAQMVERANLEHYGFSKQAMKDFANYITKVGKNRKKILKLANYFCWVACGNDPKSYITEKMNSMILAKHDAKNSLPKENFA